MLEGTPVSRKLKDLAVPVNQKRYQSFSHHGKPTNEVLVAELVAPILERLRPTAAFYDMSFEEVALILKLTASQISKAAREMSQAANEEGKG
jgi:hypothetical protein